MELSDCGSRRSPIELAEFIQIQLSGCTIITQCDKSPHGGPGLRALTWLPGCASRPSLLKVVLSQKDTWGKHVCDHVTI